MAISRFQANETVFRESVRKYLRDMAPFNTLLSDKETPDDILDMCIEMALSDFNTTAPVISNYSVQNFPSFIILVYGTVIQVLMSAGVLQSRNDLDYNAAGVSVRVSDKAGQYQQWIANFQQQYEVKKTNLKIFMNAEMAWGGVDSEYGLISGNIDGWWFSRYGE